MAEEESMDIAVYCAWRDCPSREYRLAEDVGREIAERGHRLVFGGGDRGSMARVAMAARDAGGWVTSVTIPEWVRPIDSTWNEPIVVDTLTERKKLIDGRADAYFVLPGSIGTLTEKFTSIEHHWGDRPMAVVDPWGYYDGLLEWLPRVLPAELLPTRVRDAASAVAVAEGRVLVR